MPDNMDLKGSPDSKRINVGEAHEVTYWCDKFNCSKEELIEAVNEVGTSASAVEKFFKK